MTEESDVEFIKIEEALFRLQTKKSQEERLAQKELYENEASSNWIGLHCFLRLIEVCCKESLHQSHMNIHRWEGREGTDARNSVKNGPSFFELASDVFNDPSAVFTTDALPDLHEDYAQPITLKTEEIPECTPDKFKSKLSDMRAKVIFIKIDLFHNYACVTFLTDHDSYQ